MTEFETRIRRVLVVNDEPNLRLSFKMALETENYGVDTAKDGADALDLLNSQSGEYSAMLLDLRMPGMDGLMVLKRLRERKNSIPTILCSAHMDSSTAIEAAQLGVIDFLAKPVLPPDLWGALDLLIAEESRVYLTNFDPTESSDSGMVWARHQLRYQDVDGATATLDRIATEEKEGANHSMLWRMVAHHLKACQTGEEEDSQFASSRFYRAADILGHLAHNLDR